jgi:hypothetical protein
MLLELSRGMERRGCMGDIVHDSDLASSEEKSTQRRGLGGRIGREAGRQAAQGRGEERRAGKDGRETKKIAYFSHPCIHASINSSLDTSTAE